MACRIIRNSEDKITKVLNSEGEESKLFIEINKSPLIKDTEGGITFYKNIETNNYNGDEAGVTFAYQVPGGEFVKSYSEALNKTPVGAEIKAGLLKGEEFKPLITQEKSLNKGTEAGFINASIQEGVLSEEKMRVGDNYKYIAAGESDLKRAVNGDLLFTEAQFHLGAEGVKKDFYSFSLEKTKGKTKVYDKQGNVTMMKDEELRAMSIKDVRNNFEFADEIVAARFHSDNRPIQRDTKIEVDQVQIRTEDELQLRLLGFLNKLGVSVTSISNYVKNYTTRNGVSPNAQALADIANKVVAFQAGSIDTKELTEEVAHFIVEAMPSTQTVDVLRNIEKSDEWLQFSDVYRQIYAKDYSGEELDQAVRREILGKILANSIANNFLNEGKSSSQINFIQKALDLITKFFNSITNNFKPQYLTELETYLEDAENLMLRDDLSKESNNLTDSIFRLYNVNTNTKTPETKLLLVARKATEQLTNALQTLRKSGGKSAITGTDALELSRLSKQLETTTTIEGIATIVNITSTATSYIKKAIEDSQKNGKNYVLSNEEVNIFQTLTNQLLPTVSQIKELLREKKGKDWEILSTRIEELQVKIQEVEADKKIIGTETVKRLIDEIIERGGYPESSRQFFESYMDKADGDINSLSATFGTLVNSKDLMIGLFGKSIVNMNNKSHQDFQTSIKTLQDSIKKAGYSEKDVSDLYNNGYIISPYNFEAHEKAHNESYFEAYSEVMTSKPLTPEALLEKKKKFELELTPEEAAQIKNKEATLNLTKGLDEKPKVEAYYREQLSKYGSAGITNATITWLSRHLSDVGSIQQRAKNSKGQTDLTLLSLQDQEALKSIQDKRKAVKSYVTEGGFLKRGLEYVMEDGIIKKDSENRDIVQAISGEDISEEAQITLDLNKLDALNSFSQNGADVSQEFLDGISEVDDKKGRAEAINFLNLNSYLSIKSEFWDNLGSSKSIIDKLRQAKEENPNQSDDIDDLITDINRYNSEIKSVLKIWAKKGNPSEIRGDISQTSKDTLLNHSTVLEGLYKRGRDYTKNITEEEVDSSSDISTGVTGANEAFTELIKDLGFEINVSDSISVKRDKLNNQIEQIIKHSTNQKKDQLLNDKFQMELYLKGDRKTLPPGIARAIEGQSIDLKNEDQYIAFMKDYAEKNLLPYFKRFVTKDYEEFKRGLENTPDIAQYLTDNSNDPSSFIEVAPHYSFQEQSQNNDINPNYDVTTKVGYSQPNATKFKNQDFFNKFGQNTKVENMRIVAGTSSNQKLADVYNATIQFNEESLNAMGMENTGYNYYTAPQIRKANIERYSSTIKGLSGEKLRLALKDGLTYTEEEQIKGQIVSGEQGKVIPKMYVKKLDDQNDISSDLFYSLSMRSREGFLRNAREQYYGEISSIMDKVSLRDYGKAFNNTNTYQQMKSAFDYNVYGVKEEKTMPFKTALGDYDGVKILKTTTNFIRLKNLGFSPIIAATGAGTMKVQQIIERVVGQYFQKRTYKIASTAMRDLLPDAMREFGQINTQSKLNVLGQFYQAFNLDEGLENSQYGFVARLIPRTAMGLYSATSYTFFARNLLNVLHDYRVVDGKMRNFQAFRQTNRSAGKTAKQVTEAWDLLEENTLYKFIDTKDGQVNYDKVKLGAALNLSGEALQKEIDSLNAEVRTQTKNLNIKIDNSLDHTDKVYAQRHFLYNMLMMHKGYLVTSTENRFKSKHKNIQTGQLEEGSYTGTYNFLGGVIKEWRENGHNVVQAFRDEYNGNNKPNKGESWEDIEIRQLSLKRVGVDLVIGNSLMLLAMLMRGIASDPDKKDIFGVQMANLITYKVASETFQNQQGIYLNYVDVIESPIVAWSSAMSMGKIVGIASSDEREREKGLSALAKNIPISTTIVKMRDLESMYKGTVYYNETVGNNFRLSPAYNLMLK
jgi:hypothetical protein